MLRNYFKIAWRNLWKNKTFTALNLGGLTISLCVCLMIFFWVKDELNYDTAASNADRVHRVSLILEAANQPNKEFAVTSPMLAPVLVQDFPEIEKAVRIARSSVLIGHEQEHFFTDKIFFADDNFFEVFGYTLLQGDARSVLKGTNAVVLTETIAKKLFGTVENAVGKTITSNDTTLLNVTGVAKDLPSNNHFHFDAVASITRLSPNSLQGWWNDSYYTYILLKDARSASSLQSKIATIMDKYNAKQNKEIGLRGLHFLQPLKSIHLKSDLRAELEPNGKMSTLKIFIGIGIFLLVVACINYINLTTAISFRRAKEIGMRKVSGAVFSQLFSQFLIESVLITLTALIIALGLSQLCLPFFNQIAGSSISLSSHLSLEVIVILIAFAILLGIVSGLYPAAYLAGVRPVKALKKITEKHKGSFSLRQVLVVSQFSLSIILIIATIVALKQLRYMQSQNLGFDKEQVIAFPLRNQAEALAKETIKEEFRKISGVSQATSSSSTPGKRLSNITVLPEGVPADHIQTMNTLAIDYDFIETYKLKITAGRAFSSNFNDSSVFILNETAVKELGWGSPQNAIGKGFNWGLGKEGKIIGVVQDFHFNSLQQKVMPVVMHLLGTNWYDYVSVRVNTSNTRQIIGGLQSSWTKMFPSHPFEYFFVDEDYDKQYQTEQRLTNLSIIFSMLTIFISCLGLLGLVMVAVAHRTKEIGVRKVLGASVSGITVLLSKDFLKLVGIALIIASPVAWWLMNTWLQEFAFRITIPMWVFGLAGLLAVSIAVITISFRAIAAAMANPVKSLRTE